MNDLLDAVMKIMDAAFDPRWGEMWTRSQVADSLAMPRTHLMMIDAAGAELHAPYIDPAGFVLVRSAPGEEELLLVAVHPQYRGLGLGRALLQAFASAATRRGAERIFLEMRCNNPAGNLYLSFGFEPIGRRQNYYRLPDGGRLDAITFAKEL